VEAAEAQLADIEAGARPQELAQARAAVSAAHSAATKAGKDFSRIDALVAQGAMSPQQLDAATTALDAARADEVRARETLALLEAGARTDQITAAKARVRAATAAREKARDGVALAKKGSRQEDIDKAAAAVRQAMANHDAALAQLSLVRAGARRGASETARRQVDETRAALQVAEANRRSVDVRRREAEASRAQALQAQAAADAARAGLEKFRVLIPSSGVIDKTHVRPGEVVKPGSSIATLVDFSETWVTVYVPEPLLPRLVVGQTAQVSVDGLPGRMFPGSIRRIASEAEFTPKFVQTKDERARMVFAVEIALDNADGKLKPGMPADALFPASYTGARR